MHANAAMQQWRLQELVAMVVATMAAAMAAAPAVGEELNGTSKMQQGRVVPAVMVFGDSIVDPGNNNGLQGTQMKANHAPYGMDFIPSNGRFSNALIPSDFFAQRLGVKQLLPPYLNVDHTPEDLLTGVSFASGATGFDPLTPALVRVFTMEQQLGFFDEYRGKLVGIAGEQETQRIIEGAMYVVCAGTDDFANTYFMSPYRAGDYDIPSYVDLLLVGAESFLRNLTARGARKIGFVGMPPIGCVPSQRTLGGPQRRCEARRNYAALMYNAALQELIGKLSGDPGFPGDVVYFDIYTIIQRLVDRGAEYGFTEMTRGCCGTGLIEVTQLCDTRFMAVCDDVNTHVFFDSYHPTQRAYTIIVDYIFDNFIPLLHL